MEDGADGAFQFATQRHQTAGFRSAALLQTPEASLDSCMVFPAATVQRPYQRLQVRGVLEAARKATLELPVPSAGLSSKGKKRLNVLNVLVTPGRFRGGL